MVSAGNADYLFGYYIWFLAHPELRNMTFDSERDLHEMDIHAVNPYVGLDGDYNYLDYCDVHMSRGGQVALHYQIWNTLMNNLEVLAPIFDAKFRLLKKEFQSAYDKAMNDKDHPLHNDATLISRYDFIEGLNIAVEPLTDDEYNTVSAYVKSATKTVENIAQQLEPSRESRRGRYGRH